MRIKNFRYLLTGTLLSNAAQWIQQVTISWLIHEVTGSGALLGTANLVRGASAFLAIPFIGWLVDRMERKRFIMLENGLLFIITFSLAILLLSSRCALSDIFIFSAIAGICQTADFSLRQILVFDVLPRMVVPRGIALIQTGGAIMRSLGPAIGGFFILWFGSGGNFLLQSFAYVLVAITLSKIDFPKTKLNTYPGSFSADVWGAINFILNNRVVSAFFLLGLTIPVLVIPVFVVLTPIYTKDVFRAGPEALGLLLSSVGVGGVVGGIAMSLFEKINKKGVLQCLILAILGVVFVFFSFSRRLNFSLALFILAGFLEIIVLVTNQTVLQLSIPDEIRGRITTLINLNVTIAPVSGLVVGVLKDKFYTPVPVTAGMGVLLCVSGILLYLCSHTIRSFSGQAGG